MINKLQLARNIVSNWIALFISILASFFLSPFVVNHLGNTSYGVWILVNSLISYMKLLDLGLGGTVSRFVAREHAVGDHAEASRTVSAVLWIRLWVALVVILLSNIFAWLVPFLFAVPEELWHSMRLAVIVSGINAALTLVCGVFGSVLLALQRFDIANTVTIVQTLTRALGVIFLLWSGYGIVSLALWELVVSIFGNGIIIAISFRVYRGLKISLSRPAKEKLQPIWKFSSFIFLINISIQLVYYTDNLIVGCLLSAGAVTFYAIGGTLVEYFRQLVAATTSTFTPLASRVAAQDQPDQLRNLLAQGTRIVFFVALPIIVTLLFRGPTFIHLWMGEVYSQESGRILRILLVSQIFAVGNLTSGGIVYALGKHKPVAFAAAAEAIVNVGLSTFLALRIGIDGVAWGTVVPNLVTQLLFWPPYVSQLVNISLWSYLWQAWGKSYLAVVPFAVACYLVERYWIPTNLLTFFLQILTLLPFLIVGVTVCFWREAVDLIRSYPMRNFRTFFSTTAS